MKIILMDIREKSILRSKMERRKKLQSIYVEQTDEGNQLLSPISKTWVTSKYEKEALLEQGHQWKQGQWASEEVRVLQANIADYCKLHDIDDPTEIIFNTGKERKDFYRTIAVGLERPLFSVYRRVVRMYDKKNYIGKYTPDELGKLKELQKKFGCDWASIGHAIGRSASSVKDRCRLLKNKYKFGKWETEEEEKLCEIVYKMSCASPGEDITSGLSWSVVSQHVGSRNEKQCRTKWLNYLNWKQKGGSAWTSSDDKLLLHRLSQLDAKDEVDVDWVKLSQDWPSVRSPQWLRCKWWFMKRKINNYNLLSFKDILSTILSSSRVSESDSEYLEIQQHSNIFESDIIIIQPKSTQDHPEEVDLVNFDTTYLTGRFPPSEFSEDPICNQSLPFPTFDASTIFQTDGDFMLLEDECENQMISETVVTSLDNWIPE